MSFFFIFNIAEAIQPYPISQQVFTRLTGFVRSRDFYIIQWNCWNTIRSHDIITWKKYDWINGVLLRWVQLSSFLLSLFKKKSWFLEPETRIISDQFKYWPQSNEICRSQVEAFFHSKRGKKKARRKARFTGRRSRLESESA